MEMIALNAEQLDAKTRAAILGMERERRVTDSNWEAYWGEFRRGCCFGCYDNQELVGVISVWPECTYYGGSLLIQKLMYRWDYNTPEFIADMLKQSAEMYCHPYICMEIHKHREWNRSLYLELGFEESVMHSPKGDGYALLLCRREKLLTAGEK